MLNHLLLRDEAGALVVARVVGEVVRELLGSLSHRVTRHAIRDLEIMSETNFHTKAKIFPLVVLLLHIIFQHKQEELTFKLVMVVLFPSISMMH